MKPRKILVPLDGSSLAEAALPTALELVQSFGAKLLLVRSADPRVAPGTAMTALAREAEDDLARVADRLRAVGLTDVEVSVWSGPAARAIVEAARLYGVDLIVMTTHGRSGLGRLVLGSVAESVLRGSTISVLLVRLAEAPVEPPSGEAKPWPEIGRV